MSNDDELNRLIRKMMLESLVALRPQAKCCSKIFPPGYEIRSEEDLERLLRTCKIVLINYYSNACPYCELFAPVYMEVAEKYNGKAVFARVNVMYAPDLAWRYYVMATPTTLILSRGEVLKHIPGYIDEEYFEEIVRDVLSRTGCT